MTYFDPSIYYKTQDPQYRPATISYEWKHFDPPINIDGQPTQRYQFPVVTEYVDMTTGEIVAAKDLIKLPGAWPVVRFSENALRRQAVLASLRKELRPLANFILKFRNNRRGTTPGIDTLVDWYARLHGQRPSNVRRNLNSLVQAGIVSGSSLVGPIFQYSGKGMKSGDHLGEDSLAAAKYLLMKCQSQLAPAESNC